MDVNNKMTKKSRKKKAIERPWELRQGFLLFTEETAFELSPHTQATQRSSA